MTCHETLSLSLSLQDPASRHSHANGSAMKPGGRPWLERGRQAALCQRWKRSITNNATAAAVERGREKYHSVRAAFVIIPLLVSDWPPPRTISRGVASRQD